MDPRGAQSVLGGPPRPRKGEPIGVWNFETFFFAGFARARLLASRRKKVAQRPTLFFARSLSCGLQRATEKSPATEKEKADLAAVSSLFFVSDN